MLAKDDGWRITTKSLCGNTVSLMRCWWDYRSLLSCCPFPICFFSLCKKALEGSEPFVEGLLVGRAEPVSLFLGNEFHTVGLAFGYRVDLDGTDYVGEGDY